MTLVRRPPQTIAPRSAWAVPLGLGLGGVLVAVIVIGVGVGYDVAGRSPPPLVLLGLSLLIGPQFWLARQNYRQIEQFNAVLRGLTSSERASLRGGDDDVDGR